MCLVNIPPFTTNKMVLLGPVCESLNIGIAANVCVHTNTNNCICSASTRSTLNMWVSIYTHYP